VLILSEAEQCWILKSLKEVDFLDGDNKYWCAECVHHAEAKIFTVYRKLPEILMINIKRFDRLESTR